MKKGLFTTIALLASVALVACGTKKCDKHSFGDWEETTPATCTTDGVKTRKCKVCGEKETKPIAAGHKYGEWTVETAATCAAEGVEARVCSACQNKETRPIDKTEHTWGEPYDVVEATCAAAGSYKVKCSVCQEVEERTTKKADHDWESQGNSAAVDGTAATEQFKCKLGDHYALRWSAQAMDEAATLAAMGLSAVDSTLYSEINNSGSHAGSIRLKVAENNNGTEAYGTHAIYKVNLGAAAENVDLSFQIDPKSGFDVPVFDYVDGDQQQGYIKNAEGQLQLTTKRYGLKVNGVDVALGEDLHGDVNGGSKLWFNWNVKMNLQAGVNTIDVYCLGGYRAYIYNFQLDGLTAAQLPAKAA